MILLFYNILITELRQFNICLTENAPILGQTRRQIYIHLRIISISNTTLFTWTFVFIDRLSRILVRFISYCYNMHT